MLFNSLLSPISQHTTIILHCNTISADHFVLNKHIVKLRSLSILCLPVSTPLLCLSVSIYQLEVEFPIRYVVPSDKRCTSSLHKYNTTIIIVSTSTTPTSSQRDLVHFEKSHTKHRGNQLKGNQHLQTDIDPTLQRVLIW